MLINKKKLNKNSFFLKKTTMLWPAYYNISWNDVCKKRKKKKMIDDYDDEMWCVLVCWFANII